MLPLITALVAARPTYGYRRITAILNGQLRAQDLAPVNHKRVYRIKQRGIIPFIAAIDRSDRADGA